MMNSRLIRIVLPSLVSAMAAVSFASDEPLKFKPYVGIGLNSWSSKDVRNLTRSSSFYLMGGATLGYKPIIPLKTGTQSVEIGYTRSSKNGNFIQTWSLSYVERVMLGQESKDGGGFYGGLGVGAYFKSGKNQTTAGNNGNGGNGNGGVQVQKFPVQLSAGSFNRASLGGQILFGYQFAKSLFVEGGYRLSGSTGGFKTDGFTATLGYRF